MPSGAEARWFVGRRRHLCSFPYVQRFCYGTRVASPSLMVLCASLGPLLSSCCCSRWSKVPGLCGSYEKCWSWLGGITPHPISWGATISGCLLKRDGFPMCCWMSSVGLTKAVSQCVVPTPHPEDLSVPIPILDAIWQPSSPQYPIPMTTSASSF